jgi:predicted AlkP superfamily phosphohydrolase/phosphomutase
LVRDKPIGHISVITSTLLLLVAVGCSDSGEVRGTRAVSSRDDVSSTIGFDDLDGFLASDQWKRSIDRKVVFVGIDGAAWEFIDPLIRNGDLPNLRRVKEEGTYGRLSSIPCYVSPPAWTSMLTGCSPEETGVYSYGMWDGREREFGSVSADDVETPSIWDIASYCGKKVGVFNVPMTYPPRPVNGVMVSGMMTPYEMGNPPRGRPSTDRKLIDALRRTGGKSFSPISRTVTEDSLNAYLWSLYDTVDDQVKDYDVAVLAVVSRIDTVGGHPGVDFYTFDVGSFSPWIQIHSERNDEIEDAWCKVAVVKNPDGRYETRVSPQFYDIESTYTYPDTFAAVLKSKFDYYIPSAFAGSDLVPDLTRDAVSHASYFYDLDDWDLFLYVFTQSDNIHHLTGFSPAAVEVYKRIDRFIGRVLDNMPDGGTLVIASDHGFREYSWGVDINRLFTKLDLLRWRGEGDVDYENTLVFHNIWHLYFNHDLITRDELGKRGINLPPGQDPLLFFTGYVQQALESIKSPDGRTLVTAELCETSGDGGTDAPDMFVKDIRDEYLVDFLGFARPHPDVIRKLDGVDRWWHKRDGVFLVKGEGVRRGFDAGTMNIQDIAPTILYLLGLPATIDMDGVVARDIIERRRLAVQNASVVKSCSGIARTPAAHDLARQSLEKKLRTLGYIR